MVTDQGGVVVGLGSNIEDQGVEMVEVLSEVQ